MITKELKERFEKVIEIKHIDWNTIEDVCKSDTNILRPILGIAYEEYFKKIIRKIYPDCNIINGVGDSDIDLYINNHALQLKTINKENTIEGHTIGVSLHKTHGKETRPHNLYSSTKKTFDFLVVKHPESGSLIVPYDQIPKNKSWEGYLNDPAIFSWDSSWLNQWGLIGLNEINGKNIDIDSYIENSELPFLSQLTKLEDYEIIEMLTKPEYFRAAVMGLKGNLKEWWLINTLTNIGYKIFLPKRKYSKYDCIINTREKAYKVQIKGTSKNMCNLSSHKIGFEIMGTHGHFPKRGYKKKRDRLRGSYYFGRTTAPGISQKRRTTLHYNTDNRFALTL
ncbi:hypothetical protein [Coprobacter sp.]